MIKVIDITHQKNNETDLRAFRLLAENLPNTDVLLCDRDLKIVIAGGGEMKKHGVDANYLIGKSLIDVAKLLDLEMLIPFYKNTLGGTSASIEYEYGSDYYWLETHPIFENNNVKNMIVITRNITELKSMNVKLEQLNNTKDNILSIVAHDLRNPITAILGLSDLLMSSPPESNQYINLITRSCNNALSIIIDILDITELGNDNFTLETETTELNAFINDVLIDENHNATNKNITIHLDTNRDDIFVRINHNKFKRVISNLISNAVKFSHNGNKININTLYLNKRVLIKVQDQGIGIPPIMQEIIFDKFTKAGRKGTAGEKSFGLGMSIVKQIVNLHEGSIWIESDEEKGTTVFIELKSAI
jgi:signal transduction histidine kinase